MYAEEGHLEHMRMRESKVAICQRVAAQALAHYALLDEGSLKEHAYDQLYTTSFRSLKDKNKNKTNSR